MYLNRFPGGVTTLETQLILVQLVSNFEGYRRQGKGQWAQSRLLGGKDSLREGCNLLDVERYWSETGPAFVTQPLTQCVLQNSYQLYAVPQIHNTKKSITSPEFHQEPLFHKIALALKGEQIHINSEALSPAMARALKQHSNQEKLYRVDISTGKKETSFFSRRSGKGIMDDLDITILRSGSTWAMDFQDKISMQQIDKLNLKIDQLDRCHQQIQKAISDIKEIYEGLLGRIHDQLQMYGDFVRNAFVQVQAEINLRNNQHHEGRGILSSQRLVLPLGDWQSKSEMQDNYISQKFGLLRRKVSEMTSLGQTLETAVPVKSSSSLWRSPDNTSSLLTASERNSHQVSQSNSADENQC